MVLLDHVDIILGLQRKGRSMLFIHRELQKRDPNIKYATLRRFMRRWHSPPKIRKPYAPRSLAPHIDTIMNEIRRSYAANSSVSIVEIRRRLQNLYGISVSSSKLKDLRNELGFKRRSVQYCQLIRDENKVKRLEFATAMLEQNEIFADCIFTDESTVQVYTFSKYSYTRPRDYKSRLRARPKHPAKIHIWGGISMRGTTDLAILPGATRIKSPIYCRILEKCYLRFANTTYHGYSRLVHDNAPAHTSVYTKKKLDEWKIKVMQWPPESPDLNPIELVWGSMKSFIRRRAIRNIHDLKATIKLFWQTLTPEVCKRYIQGMQWRLQEVVKAEGGNIDETRRPDPSQPGTSREDSSRRPDPSQPGTSREDSSRRPDPSQPDTSREDS